MKKLKDITGEQILENYCLMQDEYFLDSEYKHFSKVFDKWLFGIKNGSEEVSLNKSNYLGKKTRALLKTLEVQEPKTKKELLNILKNGL